MAEWDGEGLDALAPQVDGGAARARFDRQRRTRRARRRLVGATLAVVVAAALGGVAAALVGDDDGSVPVAAGGEEATSTTSEPVPRFEVLKVTASPDPVGSIRVALDEPALRAMEGVVGELDRSAVDLDRQLVTSFVVADDACPPELVDIVRDGDLLTPVLSDPPRSCDLPFVQRGFVVALDRSWTGPRFTLRLPADPTVDLLEQRHEVLLVDGDPPAVGFTPDQPLLAPGAADVLSVTSGVAPFGSLDAAVGANDLADLWADLGDGGPVPDVDWADRVVVAATVPGSGCPPEVVGFEDEGGLRAPVVAQEDGPCTYPLLAWTVVASVSRSWAAPSLTLRLPFDGTTLTPEHRLTVEVPRAAAADPGMEGVVASGVHDGIGWAVAVDEDPSDGDVVCVRILVGGAEADGLCEGTGLDDLPAQAAVVLAEEPATPDRGGTREFLVVALTDPDVGGLVVVPERDASWLVREGLAEPGTDGDLIASPDAAIGAAVRQPDLATADGRSVLVSTWTGGPILAPARPFLLPAP